MRRSKAGAKGRSKRDRGASQKLPRNSLTPRVSASRTRVVLFSPPQQTCCSLSRMSKETIQTARASVSIQRRSCCLRTMRDRSSGGARDRFSLATAGVQACRAGTATLQSSEGGRMRADACEDADGGCLALAADRRVAQKAADLSKSKRTHADSTGNDDPGDRLAFPASWSCLSSLCLRRSSLVAISVQEPALAGSKSPPFAPIVRLSWPVSHTPPRAAQLPSPHLHSTHESTPARSRTPPAAPRTQPRLKAPLRLSLSLLAPCGHATIATPHGSVGRCSDGHADRSARTQ